MIKIEQKKLKLTINEKQLKTLTVATNAAAHGMLAKIWGEDPEYLTNFLAIYYDSKIKELDDNSSFITLTYNDSGYIIDPREVINISEARKQIDIDLEIINRESGWSDTESIYFSDWWPAPDYNMNTFTLEFGVSLRDNDKNIINKTLNRIILTRYGYLEINYSLSSKEVKLNKDISIYQEILNEITASLKVEDEFRFQDINEDIDYPSKSKMLNLVLSAEIF